MKTTSIYALCEPASRLIRYIGKATGRNPKYRFTQHLNHSGRCKTHLGAWLRKLKRSKATPNFIVLSTVVFDEGAKEECRFIAAAKMLGFKLTNSSDGGEGAGFGNQNSRGHKDSKEALEKKRQSMLGNTHLLGHKHSEEAKKKISKTTKGRKKSKKTRERMSLGALKRWQREREQNAKNHKL